MGCLVQSRSEAHPVGFENPGPPRHCRHLHINHDGAKTEGPHPDCGPIGLLNPAGLCNREIPFPAIHDEWCNHID